MENIEIQATLEEIGLEKKEINTYLALLSEKETTATKISKITGIDRTFTYEIINKLIKKGFVSYIIKENKKYFSAANPEVFLKNLDEKREKLKKILPDLKARQKLIKEETKIEVFKGKKGISHLLRLMASTGDDYFFIGGLQEICTKFENDAYIYIEIAKKLKAKGKIIARKKDNFFIGKNEDYRFVPDKLISSTSMLIVENKTIIFVWSEPYYAILIENNEITKNNLAQFYYLWEVGKKPSKKDKIKREQLNKP